MSEPKQKEKTEGKGKDVFLSTCILEVNVQTQPVSGRSVLTGESYTSQNAFQQFPRETGVQVQLDLYFYIKSSQRLQTTTVQGFLYCTVQIGLHQF